MDIIDDYSQGKDIVFSKEETLYDGVYEDGPNGIINHYYIIYKKNNEYYLAFFHKEEWIYDNYKPIYDLEYEVKLSISNINHLFPFIKFLDSFEVDLKNQFKNRLDM
jgi:hypothetical protein